MSIHCMYYIVLSMFMFFFIFVIVCGLFWVEVNLCRFFFIVCLYKCISMSVRVWITFTGIPVSHFPQDRTWISIRICQSFCVPWFEVRSTNVYIIVWFLNIGGIVDHQLYPQISTYKKQKHSFCHLCLCSRFPMEEKT